MALFGRRGGRIVLERFRQYFFRLSSFFSHKLFTNFLYDKTIKRTTNYFFDRFFSYFPPLLEPFNRRFFFNAYIEKPKNSYKKIQGFRTASRCKSFFRIAQRLGKRATKKISHFVTLCCGILTIETSDCFFRSFCFIGQNGTFSTTEQNGIFF